MMGNYKNCTRGSHCDYHGGKRAQHQQKQAAWQSLTLKRAREQKERLELEKLKLENQIRQLLEPTSLVRPPQHVLDLAAAIRDQTARQRGTIVSFHDSYLVLRIYANFVLSPMCQSHTDAVA